MPEGDLHVLRAPLRQDLNFLPFGFETDEVKRDSTSTKSDMWWATKKNTAFERTAFEAKKNTK